VQQGYCEPDLHVFANLFEDRLERGLEAQALSRREIGGDDDVLNFFVGHLADVDLTIQLRGVGPASAAILTREIFGRRLCVQRRLVCSAGIKPAGAKVRRPVAWMAGWRGNRDSEAHRQGVPWGDCESPGRGHFASLSLRKQMNPGAEPANEGR
jgi:hypothetical protein